MHDHPVLIPPMRQVNRTQLLSRLKCCPLCGGLNAKSNRDCFVCGWKGEFDTDEESILTGLHELVLECPAILDIIAREPERKPSLVTRIKAYLASRKRKPLDFTA